MSRTEPARGMRDFLPIDVRRRAYVRGVIAEVYEKYGFEPLETPAVENIETLLGKYGEEGNQLIFKILKRGEHEATGKADLALRYDLTVPLARVVAEHGARLPRLFKRYQIQPVWRADRPARGRFREFYQCDIDAIGSTSPVVESELCMVVGDVILQLGFSDFKIRLNHREILRTLLVNAGIDSGQHGEVLITLDKLERHGRDGVADELSKRGVSGNSLSQLMDWLVPDSGSHDLDWLQGQMSEIDEGGHAAFHNLRKILELTNQSIAGSHLRFDPSLARGLSYYTGAIMEINVPDLTGSIGGGGRYDDLLGMFSNKRVPACGFSLGLERILVVMSEREMFPSKLINSTADLMVCIFDEDNISHAFVLASLLRKSGLRVMVYPEMDKIGKQIKYASAVGIPCVAILGTDEISRGEVTVKELATGRQTVFLKENVSVGVKEILGEYRG